MSSTYNEHHHQPPHQPKREPNENSGTGNFYPPSPPPAPSPLKINKDSHVIKKPPSPSYSSSSVAATKPRHPVIIYTHVPKIIHTNPKDFMALVQKLTGMSRSDEDSVAGKSTNSDLTVDKKINRNRAGNNAYNNRSYSAAGKGIFFNNPMISEDSESSSVITTDENIGEHGQVNSSLPYSTVAVAPPPPPPPPPSSPFLYDTAGINYGNYLPTFPIFPPATNPADGFLCGNTANPFASFDDPIYYGANMRSSFSSSSSSGFDSLAEFRDF